MIAVAAIHFLRYLLSASGMMPISIVSIVFIMHFQINYAILGVISIISIILIIQLRSSASTGS